LRGKKKHFSIFQSSQGLWLQVLKKIFKVFDVLLYIYSFSIQVKSKVI